MNTANKQCKEILAGFGKMDGTPFAHGGYEATGRGVSETEVHMDALNRHYGQ